MSAPRILMLGSGGRLGRLLRIAWPDDGPAAIWHDRTTSFDILRDRTALREALVSTDLVILLAGVTSNDQDCDLNMRLAAATLAATGETPVFLASSAAVYGQLQGLGCEQDLPNPHSVYGKSKLGMERLACAHPARVVNLRIGNVIGADTLFADPNRRLTLDLFADHRTPMRSYIGPQLLARVLGALATREHLHHDLPDILNIATPRPVEMGALLNAAGRDWDQRPASHTAIACVALDTQRLTQIFDLPPGASEPGGLVEDWRRTQR